MLCFFPPVSQTLKVVRVDKPSQACRGQRRSAEAADRRRRQQAAGSSTLGGYGAPWEAVAAASRQLAAGSGQQAAGRRQPGATRASFENANMFKCTRGLLKRVRRFVKLLGPKSLEFGLLYCML